MHSFRFFVPSGPTNSLIKDAIFRTINRELAVLNLGAHSEDVWRYSLFKAEVLIAFRDIWGKGGSLLLDPLHPFF